MEPATGPASPLDGDPTWMDSDPVWKDMNAFVTGINSESDRGAVLITTCYLEDRLGELVRRFLVQGSNIKALLDDFNGPFGNFSSRILGAHALGIIGVEEMRRLHIIRRIRNEFAYNISASFVTQKINDLTRNLRIFLSGGEELVIESSREQFIMAAGHLVMSLSNRMDHVAQKQLKPILWHNFY